MRNVTAGKYELMLNKIKLSIDYINLNISKASINKRNMLVS